MTKLKKKYSYILNSGVVTIGKFIKAFNFPYIINGLVVDTLWIGLLGSDS